MKYKIILLFLMLLLLVSCGKKAEEESTECEDCKPHKDMKAELLEENRVLTQQNKLLELKKCNLTNNDIYNNIYNLSINSNNTIYNLTSNCSQIIVTNNTYVLKLIRDNKRLKKIATECHFYNETERERNLTNSLKICEDRLEDIEEALE